MKKLLLLSITALALSGCSTFKAATSTVDMQTPSKAVYTAKATYDAGLVLSTEYAKLPRCSIPKAPPLCSSRAGLDSMLKLSDSANTAIQGAEDVVRNSGSNALAVQLAVASAEKSADVFKSIAQTYMTGSK